MKIKLKTWAVKQLCDEQSTINLNPSWQRGPTWKQPRQVLLLDSILRGMDIPKIYLRHNAGGGFVYDAVDGQQRLRAIWEFVAGNFPLSFLEPLADVDGKQIDKKFYGELDQTLQDKITNFEVNVAEIVSATPDEITNLFSRLQMGISLNPAELRNALLMPLRHLIDAMWTSHVFFQNTRIPTERYKRMDYCTHAFAIAIYNGAKDIKAANLKKMVLEFGSAQADELLEYSARVGKALNVLADVDNLLKSRITAKWIFVDLIWLILQKQALGIDVDPLKLASSFANFEKQRLEFNSKPELLLAAGRDNPTLSTLLYNYIIAFRAQGAIHSNLAIRNKAISAFCADIDAGA